MNSLNQVFNVLILVNIKFNVLILVNLMNSMNCVNAMSDDIVMFLNCILGRQGPSESDLRISMRYVFSVFDELNRLMTKPQETTR